MKRGDNGANGQGEDIKRVLTDPNDGSDIYLSDGNGRVYGFGQAASVLIGEELYCVLYPLWEGKRNGEFVVFAAEERSGQTVLRRVTDTKTLERVFAVRGRESDGTKVHE